MDGAEQPTILKRDALSRVTTPRERREALLDEFERSGLKGAQFARAAGINYQTFAGWLQQRRHSRGDYGSGRSGVSGRRQGEGLRLVEAIIAAPATVRPDRMTAPSPGLEVVVPGGARLLVSNAAQATLAAQLLKAIAAPC